LNLLLDTHVAIWVIVDDPRLPRTVRNLISDSRNRVTVSAISLWEIAIKHPLARKGHGRMPISATDALGYFRETGFSLLAVSVDHAIAVEHLPRLHDDPFDRLLVAQALSEPLRLITGDAKVAAYSDTVILF